MGHGEELKAAARTPGGLGKTLVQIQAEQMARTRFADMMSSAGVGSHRMGQELYYMLPQGFIDAYEILFIRCFGGKDDGGVGARGASQAEQGQLQKGKAAAKTNGKKYKKHWVIADDKAVNIKEKVDKRLRALAREIVEELEGKESEGSKKTCAECGRILAVGWKFCPFDGSIDEVSE